MPDRHAVVWTRAGGTPVKMGSLVATEREMRFGYDEAFLASGNPDGFALLAAPGRIGRRPVVHPASEWMPLHPRLQALLPPARRDNLQRRLYQHWLAKRPAPPAPGFETEWEILMLAGRNGIGHLDLFRDDREAERWYAAPAPATVLPGSRSGLWRALRERLGDEPTGSVLDDASEMAELLGPTPSVGGMIPKLLVAIPAEGEWQGEVARPGTREVAGRRYRDVVLKIEAPGRYEGVADLEALTLDLHRQLGFEVPSFRRLDVDGLRLLAVERFDRDAQGNPLPLESLFSVLAAGSREIRSQIDADWERVAVMLERLPLVAALDPSMAQREVFRRLCLALLTGNGDLHLENLAFLGGPAAVRIAPVYDPAPMRAWPQHDLLCATAFERSGTLRDDLTTLGRRFGQTPRGVHRLLEELAEGSRGYLQRVAALAEVPVIQRRRLAEVVRRTREELGVTSADRA